MMTPVTQDVRTTGQTSTEHWPYSGVLSVSWCISSVAPHRDPGAWGVVALPGVPPPGVPPRTVAELGSDSHPHPEPLRCLPFQTFLETMKQNWPLYL